MNKRMTLLVALLTAAGIAGMVLFVTHKQPIWRSSYLRYWDEVATFTRTFYHDPVSTGSLLPSSSYLAEEITQPLKKLLKQKPGPLTILEVGAGTGPFTDVIAALIRPTDHADIIEIDEECAQVLKTKYANKQNIHVHRLSVTDWKPSYKYDLIISGLPFNSMPRPLVEEILSHYQTHLITSKTQFSYFEYVLGARAKKIYLALINREKKQDFDTLYNKVQQFAKHYNARSTIVWFNILPAYVHHMNETTD